MCFKCSSSDLGLQCVLNAVHKILDHNVFYNYSPRSPLDKAKCTQIVIQNSVHSTTSSLSWNTVLIVILVAGLKAVLWGDTYTHHHVTNSTHARTHARAHTYKSVRAHTHTHTHTRTPHTSCASEIHGDAPPAA